MKKLLFTAVLALVPALFFGQAAFDKFEGNPEVTSVIVNKKTFAMLSKVKAGADKEAQEFSRLAAQIESFKVFTTENANIGADMKKSVAQHTKAAGLDELMRVKEKDMTFNIMVRSGARESLITEILVFMESSEKEQQAVIISVIGNFDADKLSELVGKVLPSAGDDATDGKLAPVNDALELSVYPNPASGIFYINADKPAEVKMYDLSGRLVKSQAYTTTGISVSDLAPATYVVEIITDNKRQTEHLVIK